MRTLRRYDDAAFLLDSIHIPLFENGVSGDSHPLLTSFLDVSSIIRYTIGHQTIGKEVTHVMTLRTKKIVSFALTLALAVAVAFPAMTLAQGGGGDDPFGVGAVDESGLALSGGQDTDLRQTIGRLINVVLGFLGIIAVIIVLIGGFKYMLSGGSEDKTAEARKMIVAGVIGLAIILSAWAITTFVISRLVAATDEG